MSEARKSTFRNFSDTFTLGQCDEVFKRNGFERHTTMTDNYCLVDSWDVADAIMTLEADRDALQAKFDDPRGNICELCESYDSEHDCAECRWNHPDNFHACGPISDNGGE